MACRAASGSRAVVPPRADSRDRLPGRPHAAGRPLQPPAPGSTGTGRIGLVGPSDPRPGRDLPAPGRRLRHGRLRHDDPVHRGRDRRRHPGRRLRQPSAPPTRTHPRPGPRGGRRHPGGPPQTGSRPGQEPGDRDPLSRRAPQARVGGDFYAAADTPHGLRLVLGDVRGKGLRAVGVSAAILGSFYEAAYESTDLSQLAHRLDTTLTRYNIAVPAEDTPERFATVVIVEFPPTGAHVSVLSCGHPPPLLIRDGATLAIEPAAPSPPVNLAALIGCEYHVDRIPFTRGDLLLLYTDGVTETRDADGGFFPLTTWTAHTAADSPSALLRTLHQALVRHSDGHLDDDIACVAILNAPRHHGP
ncbi:PP2C family protein-serine/threonine phosphatase [Streptomyces sp. NPDC051639]|uniref:PP2C family protein-serine/threonine phosphatase n=1 Tax=Streptomyces sp. NPDC051639 TaxID=3155671 RepID=UPI00344873D1